MLQTKTRSEKDAATEYRKTWAAKIRRIRRFFGPDSADSLHVLNLISADSNLRYGLLNDPAVGDEVRKAFDALNLPQDGIDTRHRIVACGESYFPSPLMHVAITAKRLVEAGDVDTIVELGSGSSDNLFRCYHTIDWPFRQDVEFFGCEFTEKGREAADLLASREPDMRFKGHPFNYYEPDLEFLKDRPRKILFFSNHSIEQITTLPDVLFETLLQFPGCHVAHNEPVGWQAHPLVARARQKGDAAFFEKIRSHLTLLPTWRQRYSL